MRKTVKFLFSVAATIAMGFSGSTAHAQLTSGNAVVAVTVVDVLALAVVVPAVPLTMGVVSDFQNGTSYTALAHLQASSNRAYDIKVKSDGDLKGTAVSTNTIPINNILVQAAPTTTNAFGNQVSLSTGEQVIVSSPSGAMLKSYDVKYSIAGNNPAFYVGSDVYRATLTYSIVAH